MPLTTTRDRLWAAAQCGAHRCPSQFWIVAHFITPLWWRWCCAGEVFYWNKVTGETQWESPAGTTGSSGAAPVAHSSAPPSKAGSMTAAAPTAAASAAVAAAAADTLAPARGAATSVGGAASKKKRQVVMGESYDKAGGDKFVLQTYPKSEAAKYVVFLPAWLCAWWLQLVVRADGVVLSVRRCVDGGVVEERYAGSVQEPATSCRARARLWRRCITAVHDELFSDKQWLVWLWGLARRGWCG